MPKSFFGLVGSRMICYLLHLGLLGILVHPGLISAQIRFEDVTQQAGLEPDLGETFSVNWVDFNSDGWPDIWIGNHGLGLNAPHLYLNQQDGTFQEVPASFYTADPRADTHGSMWADFDKDGDPDLFEVVGAGRGIGEGPSHLFRNDEGTLVDVAAALGVDYDAGRGRMGLWIDFDRDGWLDVVETTTPRRDGVNAPSTLFRRLPEGGFQNFNLEAGFEVLKPSFFALLTDVTGDRVMDLILHGYPFPQRVYKEWDSSLADLSESLFGSVVANVSDAVAADVDGDLTPEIIAARRKIVGGLGVATDTLVVATLRRVGNDPPAELTWRAKGGMTIRHFRTLPLFPETFVGASCQQPTDSSLLLLDASDITNHGLCQTDGLQVGYDPNTTRWTMRLTGTASIDLTLRGTGISDVEMIGALDGTLSPSLYIKEGGQYVLRTAASGLEETASCTSVVAADFDNDMDLDLYFACTMGLTALPSRLFENMGDGTFVKVPDAGGAKAGLGTVWNVYGNEGRVAVADYDQDGFLDILLPSTPRFLELGVPMEGLTPSPTWLYRNASGTNHWLQIDLVGSRTNVDGIGTTVHVYAGGKAQMREQNGGSHLFAQNSMRLHFGLADNTVVDSIIVYWPSGVTSRLVQVAADQILKVDEEQHLLPMLDLKAGSIEGAAEGEPIDRWIDLSDLENDALQPEAIRQPLYRNDDASAMPAIFFDGSNDVLEVPSSDLLNTGGPYEGRTLFLVFRTYDDISRRQVLFDVGGRGRGVNMYIEGGRLYAGLWNVAEDDETSPWGAYFLQAPVKAKGLYVVSLRFGTTSGRAELYINGVLMHQSSDDVGRLFAHSDTPRFGVSLGAMLGSSHFADGVVLANGEVRFPFEGALFDVQYFETELLEAGRREVEEILLDRYGAGLTGFSEVPEKPELQMSVYPNPVQNTARLKLQAQAGSSLGISIYDVLGRLIWSTERYAMGTGFFEIPVETWAWAPGIYVYRVRMTDPGSGMARDHTGRFLVVH